MHKGIKSLQRVADLELEKNLVLQATWHRDVSRG